MSFESEARICVIFPAYNEASTIQETIKSFHKALPQSSIFIVDNNSSDKTSELAQKTLEDLGVAGGIIQEFRQGKGNAIRRAFLEIDADVYVVSDADLTYPAWQTRELLQPILLGQADMVVGDRLTDGHYSRENRRPFHGFGNRLVQKLVNILFRSDLKDIMSGFRVMNRSFVKSYPILVEGFQIETDMTLHALHKRFRIIEIAIQYKDRPPGSFSKLNTFSDGIKVLFTIGQIFRYYHPFTFFGFMSLTFFLAGLVAAWPVLQDWITHKYIFHVPLAILASGCEIIAVVTFGIALVLDSLVHQQKLQYEQHILSASASRPLKRSPARRPFDKYVAGGTTSTPIAWSTDPVEEGAMR